MTTVHSTMCDGVREVRVHSPQIIPENSYLLFKFTHEGVIIDHMDELDEVLGTSSMMYDEIADTAR